MSPEINVQSRFIDKDNYDLMVNVQKSDGSTWTLKSYKEDTGGIPLGEGETLTVTAAFTPSLPPGKDHFYIAYSSALPGDYVITFNPRGDDCEGPLPGWPGNDLTGYKDNETKAPQFVLEIKLKTGAGVKRVPGNTNGPPNILVGDDDQ